MLELFAFSYIALHFLVWITLDRWLDAAAVLEDIAKRPFITVDSPRCCFWCRWR